jgi:hypothetical protein
MNVLLEKYNGVSTAYLCEEVREVKLVYLPVVHWLEDAAEIARANSYLEELLIVLARGRGVSYMDALRGGPRK